MRDGCGRWKTKRQEVCMEVRLGDCAVEGSDLAFGQTFEHRFRLRVWQLEGCVASLARVRLCAEVSRPKGLHSMHYGLCGVIRVCMVYRLPDGSSGGKDESPGK